MCCELKSIIIIGLFLIVVEVSWEFIPQTENWKPENQVERKTINEKHFQLFSFNADQMLEPNE